jgi:hypothetical protein
LRRQRFLVLYNFNFLTLYKMKSRSLKAGTSKSSFIASKRKNEYLRSAALPVAVLIFLFLVGVSLPAFFRLVLARLAATAMLALALSGLSALLTALAGLTALLALFVLITLLTFFLHIVCHELPS